MVTPVTATIDTTPPTITDLGPEQAGPTQLETLCQGHWTIENRVHDVRDVTTGKVANQAHRGHAPQASAALRNAILILFASCIPLPFGSRIFLGSTF